MIDISKFTGFDWDEANITENWQKHQVSNKECEEIFSNRPRVIIYDKKHSETEDRFFMLGITDKGRKLAVVFTIRNNKIRVISARDQNKQTNRNKDIRTRRRINMSKRLKPIPKFKNEAEEFKFWSTHDLTDYVDFSDKSKRVKGEFINLKPSTKTITVRMPESLLHSLKVLANKKDVPYQSLLKIFLSERVQEEMNVFSRRTRR